VTRRAKGGQISHGGKLWLKHGVLPVGKKRIGREVDQIMGQMAQDLGGPGEITAAQRVLLSVIRQDLIYLALVSEWANAQPHLVDGKGEVLGALGGFFLAAQGVVTRNCEKLGLRRVSPVQSLETYLAGKVAASPVEAQTAEAPPHRPAKGESDVCAQAEGQGGDE
jgi:hypothetical protein